MELQIDLTMNDEQLQKFETPYNLYAITAAMLIPLAKPEQRNNFILSKPTLLQSFRLRNDAINFR
jgi:hypothetical protein